MPGQASQTTEVADRADPCGRVGNEDAGESLIDVALGDCFSPVYLEPGLNAGQTTEPNEVQIADPKLDYCRVVLGHGLEHDFHSEFAGQVICQLTIVAGQQLGVLVRNGADHQGLAVIAVSARTSEDDDSYQTDA